MRIASHRCMIHAIIRSESDEEHFSLKLVISHLNCSELKSNSDIYWSQHFIKTHEAEFVNVTQLSECICKLCQSIYIFEERERGKKHFQSEMVSTNTEDCFLLKHHQ